MQTIKTRKEAITRGINILSKDAIHKLKELGEWLNDDVVMAHLIKKDIYSYRYASKRIRSCKDLALYVLSIDGILLDSVEECLKDDMDVVLTAVKNYGLALVYASDRLKNNSKIVVNAVNQNPRALMYAHKDLRNNIKLVNFAFSIDGPFIFDPDAFEIFSKMSLRAMYRAANVIGEKDDIYGLIEKLYNAKITGQEVLLLQKKLLQRSQKIVHNSI